jgi:cytochrome c peroxidase
VAHYTLPFWNGRADSLWAQAAVASEGALVNGSRLQTAWVIATFYKEEYEAVFPDYPLPMTATRAEVQALVETEGPRVGQCKLVAGACPTDKGCRVLPEGAAVDAPTGCWPFFPLAGKPGSNASACQPGDPTEPAGDAFDCMPKDDQEAITRVLVNFGKALAAYEYKLNTGESAFDRWVHDVRDGRGMESTALTDEAKLGARLFVGKAACVDCHRTPLFSDNAFYNAGVPQQGLAVPTEADCPAGGVCDCNAGTGGKNCLPWGALDGFAKLRKNPFRRESVWSDDAQDQSRLQYVTMPLEQPKMIANLKGAWRTPGLRNVSLTAPYMHNGSLATLEDVVDHYNEGGSPDAPGLPHARIKPLFLTVAERKALVSFMKSLDSARPPERFVNPPALPQ